MMFYYQVGDQKYFNKLQAIQHNLKTAQPIRLITPYRDDNFSLEPEQSLDELIAKHLKDLRDSYKTLKLYYSGGSDSHLLLNSCIKNKIKIDEIVCLKSGIPTADFEIENYAEPTLKKVRSLIPRTKITIKTPSLNDYAEYFKKGITPQKISTGAVGIHNYFRLHWPLDFYSQPLIEDVLHIRGMEKPKIIKHGNDYYTYFLDVDLEPHANNYQFFSANKLIQIKQSHMFLKTFRDLTLEKEHDVWNYEHIWNKSIGRNIENAHLPVKRLFIGISDNYVTFKGIRLYYHNQKEQFALKWALENRPDLIQAWYENLEQLKDITDYKWWTNTHPEMSSTGVFSDFYCLTKNQTKTVDELYPNGFKP